MEGISTTIYQGKRIHVFDFSNCGKSKEETLNRVNAIADEFVKNPLNSVLALINVSDAFFHFDTLKAFKELNEKTRPYEKKVAVVGLKGLQKVSFNTIAGSNKNSPEKAFDSQEEAMEWLARD